MKRTILFVDNDPEICGLWEKLLRQEGYTVRIAMSHKDALAKLARGGIDLSVIDVRLMDDDLASDVSGLRLASNEKFQPYPKIIFTAHQIDYDEQRKVWEPFGGYPPTVIAFVKKDENPEVLLEEIKHALDAWPRLRRMTSRVSEQIKTDHNYVRKEARWNFVLTIITSVAGFLIIFTGLVLTTIFDKLPLSIVGAFCGLVLNAIGFLFFARQELANERMDRYHQELLQTYGIDIILSLVEELPAAKGEELTRKAIQSVIKSWYPKTKKQRKVR